MMAEQAKVSAQVLSSPPQSVGACATLACLWEATAAKPGNVYRGADFEDVTLVDFLTSAAVIGPVLEQVSNLGVGRTILRSVQATRQAVATNTNLGMILLMVPLAAVPRELPLQVGINGVLSGLTTEDTQAVYQAINAAQPGGLGKVKEADVQGAEAPLIVLGEAMHLAADRDLVARQYVNSYAQVFQSAERMASGLQRGWPLQDAIVYAYLQLLADFPDSLIVRKCGSELGEEVQRRSAEVLGVGEPGDLDYQREIENLDFWLRADGHRRNPGTSADVIAAGLFVLLREQRLAWPVRFYGNIEGQPLGQEPLT